MNILLSAFACDPSQGSEPGIGWSWALELANLGHNVTVVTRERHKESIEAASSQYRNLKLRFIFIDLPGLPYKVPLFGVYPYYFAWQLKLLFSIRKLINVDILNCIHHITYGTYRTPFFLATLPVSSIFGPVGGGEVSPLRLTKGMSIGGRISEYARIIAAYFMSLDPISRTVCRYSTLILVTSEQTRRLVPSKYQQKCRVLPAVTTPVLDRIARSPKTKQQGTLRILFAGRLLEWKGLHLSIRALHLARKNGGDMSLTIVGDGECKPLLHELTRNEGLEDVIEWVSRVSRDEVLEIYERHHLVILTSLHDSGGTVILEAFARGIPVICLDLGGPGLLADSHCGACIDTAGRSVEDVIEAIAEQLVRFCWMPDHEVTMIRNAAYDRASYFSARTVVGRAYEWFSGLSSTTSSSPTKDMLVEKN